MIKIAVDALLALVALEGLGLAAYHARTGHGVPPARLWPNLAAGFLLMGGVRLTLGAGPVPTTTQVALLAVLAGAGLAHVLDLAARWR